MAAKENEICNMVFLAGPIFKMWVREDNAMILIDCGDKDKAVPAKLFGKEDADLINKLNRFEVGDYIRIKGFVKPWSQKEDGKWRNYQDIRITEISIDAPHREKKREEVASRSNGWSAGDDDIPF